MRRDQNRHGLVTHRDRVLRVEDWLFCQPLLLSAPICNALVPFYALELSIMTIIQSVFEVSRIFFFGIMHMMLLSLPYGTAGFLPHPIRIVTIAIAPFLAATLGGVSTKNQTTEHTRLASWVASSTPGTTLVGCRTILKLTDFRSHMIHSSSQLVALDLIAGWICCRCCWSRAHRLPSGRVNLLQDHHRNVKGYWKLQDTARQHPQASSWNHRGCFGRSVSPATTWRWLPSRKRRHGSSSAPGKSRPPTTLLGMCPFCNVHVFLMTLFSRKIEFPLTVPPKMYLQRWIPFMNVETLDS